jgi:hypothetical protein
VSGHQFAVRLGGSAADRAVARLVTAGGDTVVEHDVATGTTAYVEWAAPELVHALVEAVRAVDSAGLVATAVGPDDDLVTEAMIELRMGTDPARPPSLAGLAPTAVCGGIPLHRWSSVVSWLGPAARQGRYARYVLPGPADGRVFEAVNLALRLRVVAPAGGDLAPALSLLG